MPIDPITHLEKSIAGDVEPVTHLEKVIAQNGGGGAFYIEGTYASATLIEIYVSYNDIINAVENGRAVILTTHPSYTEFWYLWQITDNTVAFVDRDRTATSYSIVDADDPNMTLAINYD